MPCGGDSIDPLGKTLIFLLGDERLLPYPAPTPETWRVEFTINEFRPAPKNWYYATGSSVVT